MKKKLQSMLVCFGVLLTAQVEVSAQVVKLQDYVNKNSPLIGTFQNMEYYEAGFSGLYPIAGTNGKEFWTVSNRGVNVDAANANPAACHPTYDKLYGFANYAPKIHRIRVHGDSIQILQTITMKRPDGTGATGLLNPTGFGSTAIEQASTDVVTDCADFATKTAQKDIWGIDSEGIVVDKQGNFWICEEGGPTIWKLNSNGVVINRFTPYGNLQGIEAQDIAIDDVFKNRKNNRGFEGIAITPSGKIYAMIQSPLLFPSKSIGEATQVHRLLEIDPATNTTKVFVYLNAGIIGTGGDQIRLKDWKLSDMAAISDSTFLVIEAALRGTTDIKKIYKINITGATPVTSALYSGSTVEGLVNMAGLTANNIVPVKKTLFLDLYAVGWDPALEKAEGLAIINDSTIAVSNDNDYGQFSPAEDGIATATGIKSHLVTYRLKGANKLNNYKTLTPTLAQGQTGISTSQTPYLMSSQPGVEFTSILTTKDDVNGYKMVGLPDGLGAYDNGDGTFTVLMNHELGDTKGVIRAHGSIGAFVSKWVIKKSDLSVVSGSDLVNTVKLWNGIDYSTFNTATPQAIPFNRFCSADLAAPTAYYNSITGLGTQDRIFMNGEEGGEGRAIAHIATGAEAGTAYELPALGKFSWENSVASPIEGNKTIVAGMDDGTGGQVYFYVGTKTNAGSVVDKAGLTNGKLYGVAIAGLKMETSASVPTASTAFTLVDLGDVRALSMNELNKNSVDKDVTTFMRPEDGAWDPKHPNDFYFATTNSFTAPSRLWKLSFKDAANPEIGGTITAVLDGTEGQKMLDNITIDNYGHVLLVEDVGGNAHIGKVWQYTIATDELKQIAYHDSTRFINGATNFLTQDEEASGVLDVESILGKGMFLTVVQAHYGVAGEFVEGGQLLAFTNTDTKNGVNEPPVVSGLEVLSNSIANIELYPNPTDNTATIKMVLDNSEQVNVAVFDIQGKEVMPSINKNLESGEQNILLNTSTLSDGTYIVEITTETYSHRIRIVVMH